MKNKTILKGILSMTLLSSSLLSLSSCFLTDFFASAFGSQSGQTGSYKDVVTTHNRSNYSKTGKFDPTLPTVANQDGLEYINYNNENYLTLRDLGHMNNMNYMPSTGDVKILVVPVIFNYSSFFSGDYSTTNSENNFTKRLNETFFSETAIDGNWESVHSFYKKSSYGKLNITGEVAEPYLVGESYDTVRNKFTLSYTDSDFVSDLVNDIAKTYSSKLKDLDSDNDNAFDGVWLVYNLNNYSNQKNAHSTYDESLLWAYTSYFSASSTIPVFAWASYDFMEHTNSEGSLLHPAKKYTKDAHTFIHETGHMMGLDDYYNYDTKLEKYNSPTSGYPMMDCNIGDMDPHSKFLLGWINPKVVTKPGSYTLNNFSKTGESIIIPSSNGVDSVFDEYLMLANYDPTDELYLEDKALTYEAIQLPNTKNVQVYYVNSKLGYIKLQDEYLLNKNYIDTSDITNELVKSNKKIDIINSNSPSWSYTDASKNEKYYESNINKLELLSATADIRESSYAKYSNLNTIGNYPTQTTNEMFVSGSKFSTWESFMGTRRRQNVFSLPNAQMIYDFTIGEENSTTRAYTINITDFNS